MFFVTATVTGFDQKFTVTGIYATEDAAKAAVEAHSFNAELLSVPAGAQPSIRHRISSYARPAANQGHAWS